MRPESRKLVEDMHRAGEEVQRFLHGKSFDDYQRDRQLRWAVERGFEIMGEALARPGRLDPGLADPIPERRKIVSFRNVLIHGYSSISDAVVFDTARGDLPGLMVFLADLLASADSGGTSEP